MKRHCFSWVTLLIPAVLLFWPAHLSSEPERQEGVHKRALLLPSHGRTGFTRLPPDVTGIFFTNRLSPERAAENQIRMNGSGVALGDVNGNGWCDVYLCGLEEENRLYLNRGEWRFEPQPGSGGIECAGLFSTGSVFADVNGNGALDLLVNGLGMGTRLFLNDGGGQFQAPSGTGLLRRLGSSSMALADMDGNGHLDLYVANYRTTTIRTTGFGLLNIGGRRVVRPADRDSIEITPEGLVLEHGEPDQIYRNNGDGTFRRMSWTEGAFLDEAGENLTAPPRDWGLAPMFRDLTGNGFPDIYVCNDFHSPDRVWINDGQGRFQAIRPPALRKTSTFSMSVDFSDINRNGWDDFFVADMIDLKHQRRMRQMSGTEPVALQIGDILDRPQYDRNMLQMNRGDGTYAEIAYYSGLEASGWTWSAIFLDVDLDGYEDLLMTTGHMFDTQDLDANRRIHSLGPFRREEIPKKILLYPPLPLPNAAFRNRGDLTFEEAGEQWGFDTSGVSHGMALGDLDNDGDLDVVVNNLNAAAGVYRNETVAPRIGVRLKGAGPNTQGIGSKIWVHGGAVPLQSQEVICGGRYLSGDDPMRVFAAGTEGRRMRIEVEWRNGGRSVVEDARANFVYEIREGDVERSTSNVQRSTFNVQRSTFNVQRSMGGEEARAWFEDVSRLLEGHGHTEQAFDDFRRQPLLPRRLSQLGPGVAWSDVNGNGWDDLIVGSGRGGELAFFMNNQGGEFRLLREPRPTHRDQTGIVGWRKGEKRRVLAGHSNYEDGRRDGPGVRAYSPEEGTVEELFGGREWSIGPLALGDMTGDGRLELFVGGRVIPGRYPEAADSLLLRESAGTWAPDVEASRELEGIGLVSGAVWSDLDGDGFPELILGCEWGPVRVFGNERGGLREVTGEVGLDRYLGWWNGVNTGDFNGDGQMEIVAGNWGLNSWYQRSRGRPWRLYYGDLDGNGTVDLVEAYFNEDLAKEVPDRGFRAVRSAIPDVGERIGSYEEYGTSGVEEIFGEALQKAEVLEANTFESMIFFRREGQYVGRPLPMEAQLAPAFAVCVGDFDGDGHEDIFLSQNFFATHPEGSRLDAGRGLWLQGDGRGGFRAVPGQESGIKVYGEQRGAALGDFDGDGRVDLVVTQNGAETKLFRNVGGKPGLRVRISGPPGNPDGIGAALRLVWLGGREKGPVREVKGGGGYWGQGSVVEVLGYEERPAGVWVRLGETETVVAVPPDAREILVPFDP